MIGKVDMVVDYIEGLPVGSRVSVRQLAERLGVSDGTAYKGILLAREQGLVLSKPKSGTMRVDLHGWGEPFAGTAVHGSRGEAGVPDRAGDWMAPPLYLYHDDVAADWHRLYRPLFSAFSKCAVVDDARRICGTVDAMQVSAADLNSKISTLYRDEGSCLAVDEDTPVSELADRMEAEHTAIAYLTREGGVSGVVTMEELLHYYRCLAGAMKTAAPKQTPERQPED